MRNIIEAYGAYPVDIVEYNHPPYSTLIHTRHIERYPEIIDSPPTTPHTSLSVSVAVSSNAPEKL